MRPSEFEPSIREQQAAVSMLAHLARRDTRAVMASMALIADPSEQLRPIRVIAALLARFESGMDDGTAGEALADWFAAQAQALAAREQAA